MMRTRSVALVVFALPVALAGCPALLSDWTIADRGSGGDGSVSPGGDATTGGVDAGEETPPSSEDVTIGGDDAGPPVDAGVPTDAHDRIPDSGHDDAGSHPCGPTTCSTCCTDAGCASANANAACGLGGATCIDCAGQACSNGSCVTTSCVASSCGICTPYFVKCCKAGTGGCGCSLLTPPGPCT